MTKRTSLWLTALLLLALGGATYAWLKPPQANRAPAGQAGRVIPVRITTVTAHTQAQLLNVSGFVSAVTVVELRPQLSATVTRILVKEGQQVARGALLFELDGRAAQANVARLGAQVARDQAQLQDARRNLARNEELLARGFVSHGITDSSLSTVQALEATLAASRAALDEARVSAGYSRIVAPQAGRIGSINARVGSLVQPGNTLPLTTLTQLDPIEIRFAVPEHALAALLQAERAGPVVVHATLGAHRLQGSLSFIDSSVDSNTGSVQAKARFANAERLLWPGLLAQVELNLGEFAAAATLPLEAVQVGPQGQFVYALQADDTVSAQAVKILYQAAGRAVVEGLALGTRVVLEGGQNLRPGAKVRVLGARPVAPSAAGSAAR